MFYNGKHTRTSYIHLDTRKCKACWKCIKHCRNQVISKVDLPWHRHALILEPDVCTGCLTCVNLCQYGAYSVYNDTKQQAEKQRTRTFNNFLINNFLLISGAIMIFSGLVMQIGFHMGGPDGHQNGAYEVQSGSIQYEQIREIDAYKMVCGFNYPDWSSIHKFVIVLFSLLMIYHTCVHWRWYKGVINKRLMSKNGQIIILSVLFLLVAVTGFVPWFIDLSGSNSIFRILFIEIHDKLTLILIVFLILHAFKRAKWFSATYTKLKKPAKNIHEA